ncbi:carboxypeptidase regulatory-like domain-containing protein [Chishuiella sp.]|uniref:carboxypeptidase regulatory-like domain-containing protein n=1 Tax=Chishuiella sp. TaxID=1969467 RepID=UPI0028B1D052|nr:carboxypeptidase regulatory-like domain-containing protein [Chishuiella sp.]
MNKLFLSFLLFLAAVIVVQAQTKIYGIVRNNSTGEEIYNITVHLDGGLINDEVITDRIGYFQFIDIPDGEYKVQIYGVGYDLFEKQITISDDKEIDLGDISLTFNPNTAEIGIITLTDDELTDESSTASNSGILQSSRDVFARVSAYQLGTFWFKQRGLDNKYSDILFNGVKMNKIDNGRATFNNWGGLNDVTRRPDEITYGIAPSDYAFGSLGGVTNFDTRPSTMRKGSSLAYSNTNRSYNSRLMLTYNTGLLNNGWAFMFSVSKRWANEGIIQGTYYDAYSYFIGIEKKFNEKHTLNFTSFGAPTRRAVASANTQEIIDIKGIYYNGYWGWQDGKKRNERIRKTFEPMNILTHHWNISNKTKLITTVSYQFGENSSSKLDWYNAYNPSPLYYKNLPSQANNQDAWVKGSASQLDWNSLYNFNGNIKEGYAAFWVGSDVNRDKTYSAYTNFSAELNPYIDLIVAASYQKTKSELFRRVDDLLGGKYVLGKDSFSRHAIDLNNPDMKSCEGDRYAYNYEINNGYADLYTESKVKGKLIDITLGMKVALTKFYRIGKYKNGIYENDSYGKSKTYDFLDFGIKSNFLLKIDGRNFVQVNIMYQTNAPTSDEIFPNARVNDVTVDDLKSAKLFSSDLSYVLRAPRIKARATGFYTRTKDEIKTSFGYIDGTNDQLFVSEVLTGVGKEYIGGEFAVEAQVTPVLTLSAVASIGQYIYKDNASYNLYSDEYAKNDGVAYKNLGTAYIKNYKLGGGPQSGFSLGAEYRDPKFWWFGISGNYLMNNYIDIAAYRRTDRFIKDDNGFLLPEVTEEKLKEILKQGKTKDQFMLNLNLGKTFRLGKYSAGISGSVNNVLNNRKYITSGFEQMRTGKYSNAIDSNYQKTFSPKLWYGMGITYFTNIYFRF